MKSEIEGRGRGREIALGAFILVGAGLGVAVVQGISGPTGIFADKFQLEAVFPEVGGLRKSDPVLFHGLRCGRVISARPVHGDWRTLFPEETEETTKVVLELELPGEYRALLRTGSRVSIEKTLTGISAVAIHEGTGEPLAPGTPLRGQPAPNMADLTDTMAETAGTLQQSLEGVQKLLDDLTDGDRIAGLLSGLETTLSEIQAALAENREPLAALLREGRERLGDTREIIHEGSETLREGRATLQRTQELLSRLEPLAPDLERTLLEIERGAETLSLLLKENRYHVGRILADAAESTHNVRHLSSEIRRRPWKLLYKPDEGERREIDIYDAAWAYSTGASSLHKALEELLAHLDRADLEVPRDELIERALGEIETSLKRFGEAQDLFWRRLGGD